MSNKQNLFFIIILFILVGSLYNILQTNNKLDKKVVIYAASSLKPILDHFFVENSDNVIIQYNGSQFLKHQLENGAQADFLFCADSDKCLSNFDRHKLCSNNLVLAINANLNLPTLDDVMNSDITLAGASQNVPLGIITDKYLNSISANNSKILRNKFVTFDLSASAVIARLETNQVDGAFIYNSYFNNNDDFRKNFNSVYLSPEQNLVYFYQQLRSSSDNNKIMLDLKSIDKTLCNQFGYSE